MLVKYIFSFPITKNMTVDFSLILNNAVISGRNIEYLELKWQEELSPKQLAGRFDKWLYDDEFISESMPDLLSAGRCLLTINPL